MKYLLPIQLPYKVTFRHFRFPKADGADQVWYHRHSPRGSKWGDRLAKKSRFITSLNTYEIKPSERGGSTMCLVEVQVTEKQKVKKYFESDCSLKDPFSYKMGRTIAFGRARKYFSRPEQVDLFEMYEEEFSN